MFKFPWVTDGENSHSESSFLTNKFFCLFVCFKCGCSVLQTVIDQTQDYGSEQVVFLKSWQSEIRKKRQLISMRKKKKKRETERKRENTHTYF